MLNLWLTTISLFGLLVISILLFLYAMKISVNTEDAYRVDPLPTPDDSEEKK